MGTTHVGSLLANIRPGWMFAMTNTLAYFDTELFAFIKNFHCAVSEPNVKKITVKIYEGS